MKISDMTADQFAATIREAVTDGIAEGLKRAMPMASGGTIPRTVSISDIDQFLRGLGYRIAGGGGGAGSPGYFVAAEAKGGG